jgi:hypothetical protein
MNLALPSGNVDPFSFGGTTSGGLPTPYLEEGEVESSHDDDAEPLDDVMDVPPPWVMSSTHFDFPSNYPFQSESVSPLDISEDDIKRAKTDCAQLMLYDGFRHRMEVHRLIKSKGSLDLFNMSTVISNRLTAFVFDSSDAIVEAESKAHAFTSESLSLHGTSQGSCYYAKVKSGCTSALVALQLLYASFFKISALLNMDRSE